MASRSKGKGPAGDNLTDKERAVFDQLKKHTKGADTSKILSYFPSWTPEDVADIMNSLSSKQLVDFVTIGSTLAFRARNLEEVSKTFGLETNERIIYNYIKGAGNKGIWIKDIKAKSGVHTQVVNTCIKSLEKRNLIKAVKSVKNPLKKVYMLAELEPSVELTGGAWYTDQEYDLEFITALSTQCYKFIYSRSFPKNKDSIYPSDHPSYPTASDILRFIKRSQITNVELSFGDIEQLLDRLCFDGKVYRRLKTGMALGFGGDEDPEWVPSSERKRKPTTSASTSTSRKRRKAGFDDDEEEIIGQVGDDDDNLLESGDDDDDGEEEADMWMYIAIKDSVGPVVKSQQQAGATTTGASTTTGGTTTIGPTSTVTEVPCGQCPVFRFCTLSGPVNPYNCVYFDKWFEF
ncbi:34-kDa subunit of RNA polymerase III (C) [Quaeritorhiza haematococci]|nr:34-kDa subunit of RNA polymerase III (C) [Quaeritorhiza haematococci]